MKPHINTTARLDTNFLLWKNTTLLYKIAQAVICLFVLLVVFFGMQKIFWEDTKRFFPYFFISLAAVGGCAVLCLLPWPRHIGICLFAIALLLRGAVLIWYPIAPASDFKLQLDLAMEFSYASPFDWPQMMAESNNMFYENWCVHAPFLLLEMVILKLCGHNPVGLQLIFSICSAASCVVTYHIAQQLFGRRAGIAAGLLMAIQPTLLFFMPVLSNQHAATLFFLLAVYMTVARPIGKSNTSRLTPWQSTVISALLTGLFSGLSQLVRPEMAVFHLVLLSYWLIYLPISAKATHFRIWPAIWQGIIHLLIYLCAFYILVGSVNAILQKTQFINGSILEGNLKYKIMVGLNPEAGGLWNVADSQVSDPEEMERLICERLSNPLQTISLMVKKLGIQFGTYNYSWAIGDQRGWLTDKFFPGMTQSFMFVILAMTALSTMLLLRESSPPQTLLFIVLCGFFAAFAIIEIQDRYNYLLIPIFIILAMKPLAEGYRQIACIWQKKPTQKK